jgi:hypothetical protein
MGGTRRMGAGAATYLVLANVQGVQEPWAVITDESPILIRCSSTPYGFVSLRCSRFKAVWRMFTDTKTPG